MVEAEDCLWGQDFIETYMYHARKQSYNNDLLHSAAILGLVGQSLRDVWLRADQIRTDCRIHPFVVQSSGTGKNTVFSFMSTVADAANIRFDEEGTASTAGIMGTVKQNGEIITGDLSGSGFVAWKEAQTLLKSAQQTHSSDILEVINMALDPKGMVSKTLSGGKLIYRSRTSLFCTTYDPEPGGQLDLITQGFLPRTLFIYRSLGEEFYDDVNSRKDRNLPRPGQSNDPYIRDFESDVQKLANTLIYIENTVRKHGTTYHDGESHYAAADEHIEYFHGVEEGVSLDPTPILNEVLKDYPLDVRRRALPFKTRLFDLCYKMSAALAAIDKDEKKGIYVSRTIKERHVRQAHKLLKQYWRTTCEFIQDYMTYDVGQEVRKVEQVVRELARHSDGNKIEIRDIMTELRMDKSRVKRNLATLEDIGKVESNGVPIEAADSDDKLEWTSR